MKIVLTSVGTRGDMEPFLAVAQILKRRGHTVVCAFPEQFRELAENSGIDFASLGSKFIELLESRDVKIAMGGGRSGLAKFLATLRLAGKQTPANKELIQKQQEIINNEDPDRVVYNGKAMYPIIWHLLTGRDIIFLSPIPFMHYVQGHAHMAFNGDFGSVVNKMSFSLAHFGIVTTVMMSKKWLGIKERISRKEIKKILKTGRSIYTISPSLFPRPTYWHRNLDVLGYYEGNVVNKWTPDQTLIDFLDSHDKIIFISFGSMTNPDPGTKSRILVDLLIENNIPAIINTASGGLAEVDHDPELVYFTDSIPYHWIFPQVYAVIHHGGSGTTHLGLKYGCPTLVIPHILDQFVWSSLISELGAGPKGIKIGNFGSKALEPVLLDLYTNDSYKKKAVSISDQMKVEDFEHELTEAIIN